MFDIMSYLHCYHCQRQCLLMQRSKNFQDEIDQSEIVHSGVLLVFPCFVFNIDKPQHAEHPEYESTNGTEIGSFES